MRSTKSFVAIILCAGYGTRMAGLGSGLPKPLLEVGGRPMLDYLVDGMVGLDGIGNIEIVTNQLYFQTYKSWAMSSPAKERIRIHDDGTSSPEGRLGAVGDLRFVLEYLPSLDGALVAAGDNIYRFSIAPFWRAFADSGESHVLALEEKNPEELRRTGVLEMDSDCRVRRLTEKPPIPKSTWACPSLYALNRGALAEVGPYLDAGNSSDEIGRFISHLVAKQNIFAHVAQGERLHVGNPAEYARADALLRKVELES